MKKIVTALALTLLGSSAQAAILLDSTSTSLQLTATAGEGPYQPPPHVVGSYRANEKYEGNDVQTGLRSADTRSLAGDVENGNILSPLLPDLAAYAGGNVGVTFGVTSFGISGNGNVFAYSDPSYIDINGQGTHSSPPIWAPTTASGSSSLLIGFQVSEAHAFSLTSTTTGPASVSLSPDGGPSLGTSGVLSPGVLYFLSAMTSGAAPGFGTCPDPGCDSSHKMFDSSYAFSMQVTAVPLPAAGWLLFSGMGAVAAFARRRRRMV